MEKKNTGVVAIIMVLILTIVSLVSYIIYDKVSNKDKKEENKVEEKSVINVEVKDNRFYVNGNMVDFYSVSDYKNNYENETNFYTSKKYDYKTISDVVFVKIYIHELDFDQEAEFYFTDKEGKMIKRINGINSDMNFSINDKDIQTEIDKQENSEIYIKIYKNNLGLTGSSICGKRYDAELMKDTFYYVDKITYLGNNSFKMENKVETKLLDEAMLEKYPFMECFPYEKEKGEYGYSVYGIDNYYVDIENDVLKLVSGNGTLISELVTLENSEDYIPEMLPGARYMKVSDNNKICSVTKDGIYVFMGSNRTLGDMHTDYSHMYVIYYDINTGEKSELIKSDAEGHYGDLVTCK